MTVKIKTINIHGFRGIPGLELQLDGKSFLLCGENGTGKSSVVEAIEFFFTGKINHLEGTQGLSLRRHGPHVNFKPKEVNIELIFNPNNVSLNRTFTDSPSPPEEFKEYFQITQKATFILRRSQVLEFIMSKPADRFKAIASIIGTEPLDQIELEMQRVRDKLKGEIISKEEEINDLITEISAITESSIKKVEEVLPALNKILQKAGLPLINSLEDVDKHAEEMLRTVKETKIKDRIGVLNEILETTKSELISDEYINDLNDLNNKIKHLLQDNIRSELNVVDLLESGQKIIKENVRETCPLCEQKIDREKLLESINIRLKILRDLSEEASEVRILSVPIIKKLDKFRDKLEDINSKIEPFKILAEEKSKILEKLALLNKFETQISSASDLKNEIPIQELTKQKNEINEIWSSIVSKCSEQFKSLELTDGEKKVLVAVRLIEQTRSKTKDLIIAQNEFNILQNRFMLSEKIYSTFSHTKKVKIQEIYNSIEGDIESFYKILHPNEPHKNIELLIPQGRRASTELKIESFGREREDPRALTSEGHIDSLGLCIFLGFVKKFNESCSLVVLDDVVATVDAKHRRNICKVLLEEFSDKQLIITTHDKIWFEQLRASQRVHGLEGDFKNFIITNWRVESGPTIRPYKPQWEKIQEKIDSSDIVGAGNAGRQYLEWILLEICVITKAPVPINHSGRYEVGELLPAAKKRLEHLVMDDDFKAKISDAFQELESTLIMGNLLSHNNLLADEVSIEEVNSFCLSVRNLHTVFQCPTCGNFVGYHRDLKIIRCSKPNCSNPIEIKTK